MYLSSCFTCFNLITVVVKLISYKFFKQIFKEFKHIIEYFKLQAEYNILCFIFFSHSCCVVACREKYELHSWLEQTHTVFFHCKKKSYHFFHLPLGGVYIESNYKEELLNKIMSLCKTHEEWKVKIEDDINKAAFKGCRHLTVLKESWSVKQRLAEVLYEEKPFQCHPNAVTQYNSSNRVY